MSKQTFQTTFAGKPLVVEIGQVAKQANGAVVVRYGESTVLSAAVMSKKMSMGDFFPLQVNYEEKMYAAGKFPGGFNKREGRPTTDATLTARLIDRPIRPMFAEGFRNEVQVINTVLSYDENASAPMAAMFGSSLALSISDIPFNGPIAGVQVAYIDGDFIINPTAEQKELSLLEFQQQAFLFLRHYLLMRRNQLETQTALQWNRPRIFQEFLLPFCNQGQML